MKTKIYIFLFFILFSGLSFGQTSGNGTVNLKISFSKDISLDHIDVYYIEDNGSSFENLNYIKDSSDNTLNIKGSHHWWGAPSFPTLVFSYPQKDKIFIFYLISSYAPPYQENEFNKKILFSFETPNAHINYNEGILKVDYVAKGFSLNFRNGINEMIKIKAEKGEE